MDSEKERDPAARKLRAKICVDGWAGRREFPCEIIGETKTKSLENTIVELFRQLKTGPYSLWQTHEDASGQCDCEDGSGQDDVHSEDDPTHLAAINHKF
jgi:hypothetical protein